MRAGAGLAAGPVRHRLRATSVAQGERIGDVRARAGGGRGWRAQIEFWARSSRRASDRRRSQNRHEVRAPRLKLEAKQGIFAFCATTELVPHFAWAGELLSHECGKEGQAISFASVQKNTRERG